jgi:hypothetical protein
MHPLTIFVALVGRDENRCAGAVESPQRIRDVHRSHDVGVIRFDRLLVRQTHEWLCGQMENEVGRGALD